jgi:hypothetical protein
MLQTETGLIRMSPVQSDTWQIEVPFLVSGPIGRYDVELVLDRQMIPLGPEYQGGSSLQLGIPLQVSMDLSMARNNLHVDPEHRLVQFGITWFDLSHTWKSGRYSVRKTIPFKWVSRLGVPNSVALNIKVRGVFGATILQERVIGFNLSSRTIIPVLFTTPSQKSFYFSNTGDLSLFGYRDVVRIGTALLNGGDRASWAFTGPDDTELWDSEVGTSMIRSQYRRILEGSGKEWVGRLALDPYELGVEGPQRARFSEMMEVQNLCGIDLRVVSPVHVERTTGSAHRVLGGFGAGFAAEWEWGKPLVEPESAVFHFEQDRIAALLGQYEEISAHSMSWNQYRLLQGIAFTPEQEARIMERVKQIKSVTKHIESVTKQIEPGGRT